MAALTEDSQREFGLLCETNQGPVLAATTIYKGALVGRDPSTGYLVPGADTATMEILGVCAETADNSGGASGNINVTYWIRHTHTFGTSGADQTWQNKFVYTVDDNTVALTGVTNFVKAGIVTAINSATSVEVWVAPHFGFMNTAKTAIYPLNIQDWLTDQSLDLTVNETAGTFNRKAGTNIATIEGEVSRGETETSEGRYQLTIPSDYQPGGAITIRVHADLFGVGTNNVSTIDLEAFEMTDGALGADICATAAQNLTTSWANYDFSITPTSLTGGDKLCVVLTTNVIESGGASDLQSEIDAVDMRYTAMA